MSQQDARREEEAREEALGQSGPPPVSEREAAPDERPADQPDEALADLELRDGEDVSGGSLNAYTAKLQGEKQGKG